MLLNYIVLTAFAGLASAAPLLAERADNGTTSSSTLPSTPLPSINVPASAFCETRNYTITVTPNNTQFVSSVTSNANETLLTSRLQDFVASIPNSNNFTQKYENGKKQVAGTYYIAGTLCRPKNGAISNSTVQLLVHGIGVDSSYWNFAYQPDYSYIEQAARAGYTTFSYDRLGTGRSSHPQDAYNVVQSAADVAILNKIASALRSAGIGHSYGSGQLQVLIATGPKAVDAVFLTGFSANATANPIFLSSGAYSTASQAFPDRFSNATLSNAYLVTVAPQQSQLNFFYHPYYASGAFDLARQTEHPVTQSVLFTISALNQLAQDFTGPVHIVTGAQDFIFCLNDCYAVPPGSNKTSILGFAQTLYPKASKFSTSVPANTGHLISAHYSAPAIYSGIQSYLKGALAA